MLASCRDSVESTMLKVRVKTHGQRGERTHIDFRERFFSVYLKSMRFLDNTFL